MKIKLIGASLLCIFIAQISSVQASVNSLTGQLINKNQININQQALGLPHVQAQAIACPPVSLAQSIGVDQIDASGKEIWVYSSGYRIWSNHPWVLVMGPYDQSQRFGALMLARQSLTSVSGPLTPTTMMMEESGKTVGMCVYSTNSPNVAVILATVL